VSHRLADPAAAADRGLEPLERELTAIRFEMRAAERHLSGRWSDLPQRRRDSARNLLHYLALRSRDLRALQQTLASHGLSSLGRAESHAIGTVSAVLAIVRRLRGEYAGGDAGVVSAMPAAVQRDLLEINAAELLGRPPSGRDVRIMVTMPGAAADDPQLIRELLVSGMDCMRINAAHDDMAAWDRMLRHLDDARVATGLACRVVIDVAGPKIRTGPIRPAVPVVRWKPARDRFGRVSAPARIWLTGYDRTHVPPEPSQAVLPVSPEWLARLRNGDVIKLFDARGSMRALTVVSTPDEGVWCESEQTAYIVPGTTLHVTHSRSQGATTVGELPPAPQSLQLARGDMLILRRGLEHGTPAIPGRDGSILEPASIGVTLPGIFEDVKPGEPIWFDDGSIGGVIRSVHDAAIEVKITRTKRGGAKLAADKGINLPETRLRLPALTAKDRDDLAFIDGRADLVGYSFVRTESDIRELQMHLDTIGGSHLGIILKVETRQAFENLPALLLAAMRSPSAGVMIARGDLAVECGYERLAEVQEEILWMAEASHTPVIWATQVLENLAKTWMPSRAEITDAAMSERAECVMLNKGPYVVDAVKTLDDILKRMQMHQRKKSAMLRELRLAGRFLAS
jgi:pyruvate kinase